MTQTAEIEIKDIDTLPDNGAWDPALVSSERNAFGLNPLRILYLWIFERPDSLYPHLIANGWVQVGPVHLLLSPESRELAILENEAQIREAINAFRDAPGTFKPPKLADYEVHRTYHGYPINYLWCSNSTWRTAFELAAAHCSHFVVDVSVRDRPEGLTFELGYLFDQVPVENILCLADKGRAKVKTCIELLQTTWDARATDSLNRVPSQRPPALLTYSTHSWRYLRQAAWSQWTGKSTLPIARRAAHYAGWFD